MTIVTIGPTITLYKADLPPSARRVTIKLATDFSAWTQAKQDAFVAALASAINIPIANIVIIQATAGSVILDSILIDNQVNHQSSVAMFQELQQVSGTTIGGYSTAVSDPTPTGSGLRTAPSLLVAALILVVAIVWSA